jgi:hypothetical protein
MTFTFTTYATAMRLCSLTTARRCPSLDAFLAIPKRKPPCATLTLQMTQRYIEVSEDACRKVVG